MRFFLLSLLILAGVAAHAQDTLSTTGPRPVAHHGGGYVPAPVDTNTTRKATARFLVLNEPTVEFCDDTTAAATCRPAQNLSTVSTDSRNTIERARPGQPDPWEGITPTPQEQIHGCRKTPARYKGRDVYFDDATRVAFTVYYKKGYGWARDVIPDAVLSYLD